METNNKKHTLHVTLPCGKVDTTESKRAYTHAVAVWVSKDSRWGVLSYHLNVDGAVRNTQGRWGQIYPKNCVVAVVIAK